MRTFKRNSTGAAFRVMSSFMGSFAGDLAELVAVCIFIGAIGVWAQIIASA